MDADRFLRRGSAPCIRFGSSALAPPTSPSTSRRDSFSNGLSSVAPSFIETSPRSHHRSLQPRFVEPSTFVKCGNGASKAAAPKPSIPRLSPRSQPLAISSSGGGSPTSAASLTPGLARQVLRSPSPTVRQSINSVRNASKSLEPDMNRRDDERIANDPNCTSARESTGKPSLPPSGCSGKLPLARTLQRRRTTDGSYSVPMISSGRATCLPISPQSMSPRQVCVSSKLRTASPIVPYRRTCSNDTYASGSTCYNAGSSRSSSGGASQKEQPESFARVADFSILRRTNPDLIVDVEVEDDWIDPSRSSLKPLILEVLGASPQATMQRMEKTHGGLNQGLWTVRDSSQEFVVKMVTCTRFMGLPTEAESFASLSMRAPKLAQDPSISFPVKIFHCRCSDGQLKDLIVMRRFGGTSLADLIHSRLAAGRTWELGQELQAFGKFLAEFHERHQMQHGDLQPANVIYDERSRQFSLIDVAEMGNPRIKETDAEHFVSGLRVMTKRHGPRAFEDCRKRFEVGFSEATP